MKKNLSLFLLAATFITHYCMAQNVALQWVKSIGTTGTDVSQSEMYADASGNLYITIYAESGADLDPGPATITVSNPGYYLVKYDASGNFIWNLETSGTTIIDKKGNVYT